MKRQPATRVNLTMPPDWWAAIDAARGSTPRSEWIRLACARALPAEARRQLSEPRPPGKLPAAKSSK